MATLFITARGLLAPYVDNGVATSDTGRIDARIDEAQRRLCDQYNFISRREESERPPLVWRQGGTTGVPTTGDLILDNLDATKNMILALWREENNALDQAAALEKRAYEYIERNILNDVERERKTAFQALATASNQNTLGGLTGRIGLETAAQYRLTESRIKSYINQAYQQAVDHFNFIARREDNRQSAITFAVQVNNSDIFNSLLPSEVVKLITLGLIATDNGSDGSGLKEQALGLIERNITTAVETARRDALGEEGRLHNELPEGEKILTSRLTAYLAQAATEALAHWTFLARRENYSSGTAPTPFSFEIRKKLVESYLATTGGAAQVSTALKQEAFSTIERDLMTQVEAARRVVSGEEGRLHNELPEGVKIPTTRLTTYLSQAGTEAGAHWDFVARREDYSSGTKPATFSFEIRKKLVESYLASADARPDVAASLKQEALSIVERDLMAQVEPARRTVLGEEGRLHNELPEGVKIPTARLTTYLSQAGTEAGAHWDFVARREDYSSGTKPNTFSFEIRKKLVESYLASASARPDVSVQLKTEALGIIERDIQTGVEADRRDTVGEEGRLHNELPDGVKIPTARFTTFLSQAATEAGAHWDFLARREDYSSGTKPATFSFEIRKRLVESYLASARGALEAVSALKQDAFFLMERDIMAQVEATRRDTLGIEGQLHNELPEGVKIPTSRLTAFLSQADTEGAAQQAFLQRREDYNGSIPSATYEQRKLLVESYLAASKAAPEAAATLKQTAFALIERDVVTAIEAARRQTRQDLLSSDPLSFGYHWGRIGLETQDGLKFSDSAIKRAVNSAEEQLMLSGKWLGTVEEYTLTVTETGEVYLPREIETLLFVSFDGNPRPIHDRFNEWLRGGTGYRTDDSWRDGLVDRGEGVDPADGTIKHKYFFSLPTQDTPPVIRALAKRRFVPHTNDSEALYLRNYQAVAEMAKGILSGGSGPEMDVRMKNAKEMLATQVNQQFFRGQPNIVRRRVLAMR
jgi:hypothetical protein